jgi:hypothetical protein
MYVKEEDAKVPGAIARESARDANKGSARAPAEET